MSLCDSIFDVEKVINQNLSFYQTIKPKITSDSYTVIATLNDRLTSELLALATGTQACLKRHENDIEDCHAESLLKRAYKRHVLDKILNALDGDTDPKVSNERVLATVESINQQKLVLFVSQFPCGLISRFHGPQPVDEDTGRAIVKKPGRGQVIDGKTVHVQRETCLNKIKKWTSSHGLQGKLLGDTLGLGSELTDLVIGDCEPDTFTNYTTHLDLLKRELSTGKTSIQYYLVRMKREEFMFDPDHKQPLPVATIWWASQRRYPSRLCPEYVVDGRRMGMTKKQCNMNSLKLQTSDFWLHEDLKRIREFT